MPGGKFIVYAVVRPTPGISENTTLPRDAKEGCSGFELGVAAFEMIQEEFQPDHTGSFVSAMRPGFCALIASATQHAATSRHGLLEEQPGQAVEDARCSHGAAVARSQIIPPPEMPAIDTWWACRRGPCTAPRAIARSGLSVTRTRAARGWKGMSAGLATRPGLPDGSPWRTWQPYSARGRCRLSGAAAGPRCRATRPRAPPSTAPADLSPNPVRHTSR